MTTESQPSLQQALEALRQAVQDLYRERQGPVRPPAVKQRMLRDLCPAFNESALGFLKFSEFLKRGAEDRVISLTPSDPDFLITPAGVTATSIPPSASRPYAPSGRPIRKDLWHAFVHVGEYMRFYDPKSKLAYCLPQEAPPQECPEIAALRASFLSTPDRFVAISPVSEEKQREWARQVVSSLGNADVADRFAVCLEPATPFQDILQAISDVPTVRRAWHALRLPQVTQIIQDWSREHQLDLEILAPRPTADVPSLPASQPTLLPATFDLEALRYLLKQAIDLMPARDLLSLSIPVEYVLRAGRK